MTETLTRPDVRPLVDADWGPDPLDGVPAELIEKTGAVDVDTAGGCG